MTNIEREVKSLEASWKVFITTLPQSHQPRDERELLLMELAYHKGAIQGAESVRRLTE